MFQISTAQQNARLSAMVTDIGASPVLKIYSGTLPASCASMRSGTSDPAQIEIGEAITIHLVPADTAELDAGSLKHQLRASDASGRVETLLTGVCRVTASVFQPVMPLARLSRAA